MRVTPALLIVGCLIIFGATLCVSVLLPSVTQSDRPSEIFRDRTSPEMAGRKVFIQNGCSYCHSQYIRFVDWDLGAERVAQAGDYVQDRPHQLGSARNGPDLSQEGGEHPDDWHVAHFVNPRYTRSESLMPPFEYLGKGKHRGAYPLMFRVSGSRMRTTGSSGNSIGSRRRSRPTRPVRTETSSGFMPRSPNLGENSPIPIRQHGRGWSGAIVFIRVSASDATDPSATEWVRLSRT